MRSDSRLPRVLHALLHLADLEEPVTSELIAKMLGTNSSVVRRTLSGLRDAGILTSIKGHGGGWSLSKPLSEISLLDVYEALGAPQLFAIAALEKSSGCLLEKAASEATNNALVSASTTFKEELRKITVDQLTAEFDAYIAKHGYLAPPKRCDKS